MTSKRKTKKYNAKIVVRLWKDHTPRDVKHYSRGVRHCRKWILWDPWFSWRLEIERAGYRILHIPSIRICGINVEKIKQWKNECWIGYDN